VLPEGTEASMPPGSQALWRGECSSEVCQACMRGKALFGGCGFQVLPEQAVGQAFIAAS